MRRFRQVVFWLHLCSGVLAGIFILIMCVSGALLSFQSNIIAFAERDMRNVSVPSENATRLSLTEILDKIQAAKPNAKPSSITLKIEPNAAANISLGREGQVFVNPYTGEITGEGAQNVRGFFRTVEDAHRWLALSGDARPIGKAVNDAANLLFLFLAISGLYIWFPRRFLLRHFKPILWFRTGLKGKARNFNWHNTIGFWSSLVLIILTATAVVMSYTWANNLLYRMTGNEPPPQQQQQRAPNNQANEQPFVLPENIDTLWKHAANKVASPSPKSISLRLPVEKNAAVFTIEEGRYWNKFARSTLTLNPETGEIAKWEDYGEQNAGRQLRSWVRFTHTGETGGIVGQIIGFLACIGGSFLVWTGISLALRRFGNWRGRNNRSSIDADTLK
jgi:uncharacterized iron-regulated membrane protein